MCSSDLTAIAGTLEEYLNYEELFTLYDTFGFPVELSTEKTYKQSIKFSDDWRAEFDAQMVRL